MGALYRIYHYPTLIIGIQKTRLPLGINLFQRGYKTMAKTSMAAKLYTNAEFPYRGNLAQLMGR